MVHPESDTQLNHGEDLNPASEHSATMTLEGAPLNSDALLLKYMDNLMATQAAAGVKQLMMYGIDAGVNQHSKFFEEIWERLIRSMDQITATVFDKEKGAEMGRRVRDYHADIKGVDVEGKRYHALNPKLFADTHVTFVDAVYDLIDRFHEHKLTQAEREQLYDETITWYQQYGVSDRYLPADYEAYSKRSDEMAEEYVLTGTAKRALEYACKRKIPRPNIVPKVIWSAMELPMKPVASFAGKIVISGLPEQVRDKYKEDIPYSYLDKAQVALFETFVKLNWKYVPEPLRYTPQVYEKILETRETEGKPRDLNYYAFTLGSLAIKSSAETLKSIHSYVPTPGKIWKSVQDRRRPSES